MTYQETLDVLFNSFPMFQNQGASAYKPGLEATEALDRAFGSPSRKLRAIHIAGTNGKGSTAHSLASVLQAHGMKTGLYTSPHLVDFRERMRINGEMIPESEVVAFVERCRALQDAGQLGHLSFFELTTIMAFDWFARNKVDVAVIETGLGGRLDSTNILSSPELCVITNISYDHTALLGDTLEAIAAEKAGIFKPGVPVVVGETDESVNEVFSVKALISRAPLCFACDKRYWSGLYKQDGQIVYRGTAFGDVASDLTGDYQPQNMATILSCIETLNNKGWNITAQEVRAGLCSVQRSTGLAGRWMVLSTSPLTVADTGHNTGGWKYIVRQLIQSGKRVHMVLGFVNDKDVTGILSMIATIPVLTLYLTNASVRRALPVEELSLRAAKAGLRGDVYPTVAEAYSAAEAAARSECARGFEAMVYVGGSTFVVADQLTSMSRG